MEEAKSSKKTKLGKKGAKTRAPRSSTKPSARREPQDEEEKGSATTTKAAAHPPPKRPVSAWILFNSDFARKWRDGGKP